MSNNAIAVANGAHSLTRVDDRARQQQERDQFILDNYCSGAPSHIAQTFVALCRRRNLAPEENQICLTQRGGKWVIQTTIDGYRLIADRTKLYAGSDEPVYDTEDADHPNKATVTVWKLVNGQRCPFTGSARWSEYKPVGDKVDFMWRRMPYLMVAKCAEALALRKGFPADLSGTYIDAEMDQAEGSVETTGRVVDRDTGEIRQSKPMVPARVADDNTDEETSDTHWLHDITAASNAEMLLKVGDAIREANAGSHPIWHAYHLRRRALGAPVDRKAPVTRTTPITQVQMAALHAKTQEILGRDGHPLLHWIAVGQHGLGSLSDMSSAVADEVLTWLRETHPDEICKLAAEIEATVDGGEETCADDDLHIPLFTDEEAALIAFREQAETIDARGGGLNGLYRAAGTDEKRWIALAETRPLADINGFVDAAKRAGMHTLAVSNAVNDRTKQLRQRADAKRD